jgi:hypothetical protein
MKEVKRKLVIRHLELRNEVGRPMPVVGIVVGWLLSEDGDEVVMEGYDLFEAFLN